MKFDEIIYSSLWILLYLNLAECQVGRQPEVYYANLGQNVVLSCKVGGGQYACFSSYTYQNREYAMAYVNSSRKYEVTGNSIGINNVKATDAGFYACSSDCRRMKIDQISYYLQPMSGGQPVDTSKSFLPIPRFPVDIPEGELMYVVVTNEADQRVRGAVLSGGEIAGLVIGLVAAFLITVAIVIILCCLWRRKKQRGEKILMDGQKSEIGSTDHSTVEDQQGGKINEKNSLANTKIGQDGKPIQTRNVRGPNAFRPNELGDLNSQDLPNVDINSHQGSRRTPSNQGSYLNQGNNSQLPPRINGSNSSRNPSYQGSYNNNNNLPPNRQYSNNMEVPYEQGSQQNQLPRPNRKTSESTSQQGIDGVFIQPPPPKNGPINNKINFPSRQNSSQQGFTDDSNDNPNLRQIVKDTGFNPQPVNNNFPQRQNGRQNNFPPQGQNNSQRQQPFVSDDNNIANPNSQAAVKEPGLNPNSRSNPSNPILPQYVSDDENENLHQIIKESGFLADEILSPYKEQPEEPKQPKFKQRQQSNPNADGGVTVVSARSPSSGNGSNQGFSVLPQAANRSNNSIGNQNQPPKYSVPSEQLRNQKPLLPHLSYSQRIETTSTPIQAQQPSRSLRTQNAGGMSRPKEGSTDV